MASSGHSVMDPGSPIRLGLRQNAAQFGLLVAVRMYETHHRPQEADKTDAEEARHG